MNNDADFQSEVTRFDEPNIVAGDNQLVRRWGVRLAYHASGYKSGEVLARNKVTGLYVKYDDSESTSGGDTAVAVLERKAPATDFPTTTAQSVANSVLTHAIFSGDVFYDKLTGIDANGVTDLGRKVVAADGVTLLMIR